MEDYTFSAIRNINPYVAPQWLVEVEGSEITGRDLDRELDGCEVEIIEDNVMGWGYDVIIAATAEDGQTYYYLANR
jgi:hypothetical protein